jgi:hypothetical protein
MAPLAQTLQAAAPGQAIGFSRPDRFCCSTLAGLSSAPRALTKLTEFHACLAIDVTQLSQGGFFHLP